MVFKSFVKGAALFSGKDSLYAIYLAQKLGVNVEDLICLKTTFKKPAGHIENLHVLRTIAKNMNKKIRIIDLKKGNGILIDVLKRTKAKVLVAGDVFIEDHLVWLEEICKKARLELMEPLFGEDTSTILRDMMNAGFKATVVCVNKEFLGEEWLGFSLSKETINNFFNRIGKIDPLGENGEYHTIVIDCPLYKTPLRIKSWEKHNVGEISYIVIKLDSSLISQ